MPRLVAASVSVLALLLSACGGGGGGGGGGPTPVVAGGGSTSTGGAAASTQTVPAGTASLRFDSAAGGLSSTLSAAGASSAQLVLERDAAGNPTGGGTILLADGRSIAVQSGASSTALENQFRQGGGIGALGSAALGLQFSDFGIWALPAGTTSFDLGAVAGGAATPVAAVPRVGTASYTGATVGWAAVGATPYGLAGDARATVDFAQQSARLELTNMQATNLLDNSVAPFNNLSGTASLVGNGYAGALASTGPSSINASPLAGGFNGQLNGPHAEETAGTWRAAGGSTTAVGSFAGKR